MISEKKLFYEPLIKGLISFPNFIGKRATPPTNIQGGTAYSPLEREEAHGLVSLLIFWRFWPAYRLTVERVLVRRAPQLLPSSPNKTRGALRGSPWYFDKFLWQSHIHCNLSIVRGPCQLHESEFIPMDSPLSLVTVWCLGFHRLKDFEESRCFQDIDSVRVYTGLTNINMATRAFIGKGYLCHNRWNKAYRFEFYSTQVIWLFLLILYLFRTLTDNELSKNSLFANFWSTLFGIQAIMNVI